MKFAAKVKAEPGWQVALSKSDGGVSFVPIEEWGVDFTNPGVLAPLDPVRGFDMREKRNFLSIIDPNKELNIDELRALSARKAKEIHKENGETGLYSSKNEIPGAVRG